MGVSPFQSALGAMLKPLAFAARDDFAHADRLRDLPGTVAEAAARAVQVADDEQALFESLLDHVG